MGLLYLKDLFLKKKEAYMDDIVIATEPGEEHQAFYYTEL